MIQPQHPSSRGPEEKLTIAAVCTELKISRSTFYDWRAKRRAPRCITLPNGSLRVRRRDLDRWLSTREDAARCKRPTTSASTRPRSTAAAG
jgi:predicted DNA-binding transcriptional regulator AlpA